MGQKAGSNEAIQKMTRDTDIYYGDSVSTVCAVPNTNENLRSWTLGIFPSNQAVNWAVFTWVNFNVKHTGGMTQGFITWYQLLIQKHSQNRNLTWQVCPSINCVWNITASTWMADGAEYAHHIWVKDFHFIH